MAYTKVGKITFSTWMSDVNAKSKTNKVASVSYYVTAASVTAYNAAADDAARAATTIGALLTTFQDLTLGVTKSVEVGFEYRSNLAAPAADTFAFEFDKFLISSRDAVNNKAVKSSIPARKDSAIVIESDGTTVDITQPDMSDYVTAYNAIVLSDSFNAVNVQRASISQ